LSQRVVTAMGGEIGASSAPGAGSVFHFTVPLTTVRSGTVAALPPTPPERRPVVLVVEDDALIRDVTARQLEQAGTASTPRPTAPKPSRCCAATGSTRSSWTARCR
jgi:hypothetical protein